MSKKNNKYQNFSRNNDEHDEEIIEVSVKHKGHGDQRKANRRAKQQRQDYEYNVAISDARHAA